MKQFFYLLLFVIISATVNAQNPLIDGVARTESHEEDEGIFYAEDFKVKTSGCSLEYFFKAYFMDFEFTHTYTLSLKKITKINQSSTQLDIYAGDIAIAVTGDDDGLSELTKEWCSIYFSSAGDSKAAGAWLQEQVRLCGGEATLVMLED